MMRLAALAAAAALALGCQTAFDLEGLGNRLRPPGPPPAPVLVESPAADLPAPRLLHAVSGELRAVPLEWEPVLTGRPAGYVVERALAEGGPFHRIAVLTGRFPTSVIDRGQDLAPKQDSPQGFGDLGDGHTYFYRVRVFDAAGRIAAESSHVAPATTAPAPEPPANLRAYSDLPREVALAWRASPDPTVTGYVVYRSPSATGEYRPVTKLDGRFATSWVDRALGALRVFHYRVAALNGAGGEGAASETVTAVTKPEPLPPAGLAVAGQALGMNRLRWEPNVEADVTGYRVLRLRSGAPQPELVAALERGITEAVDPGVGAGETLTYTAVAVDADGLESAPSDPVVVVGVDYGLEATAQGDAVRLRWDPALQVDFASVRVVRLGGLRDQELGNVTASEFVDGDVSPGDTRRYVVVAIRADGSEAPPSAPLEVRVPER
jgi:fibronectin type 3 domain-containing protein